MEIRVENFENRNRERTWWDSLYIGPHETPEVPRPPPCPRLLDVRDLAPVRRKIRPHPRARRGWPAGAGIVADARRDGTRGAAGAAPAARPGARAGPPVAAVVRPAGAGEPPPSARGVHGRSVPRSRD